MSNKGYNEERTVVQIFETNGYRATRIPASGGRTKRALPDVIAGNGRKYYAAEIKSSKNDYIYIKEEQIQELLEFAHGFGATPIVVVKFTYKPYKVFDIIEIETTDSGKYVISRKNIDQQFNLDDYITNK
ncbi:Holliday junction resolvase Hjc [Methanosphaera cuniculi]|uniref:Holliday junction resolvase Hjc n=1 Tax=Methanosphaera cuniculi TaxID=1077256 RepID=UPI0026DB5E20|nr:Holliday junction resolvase Hjc [Methanosphaera cuniculi]